jgi:pimeloyl-ACP methyl ester carboxylesterase
MAGRSAWAGLGAACACVVLGACGGGGGGSSGRTAASTATTGPAPAPAPRPHLADTTCNGLPRFRCAELTVPLHRRGPRAGDGRRLRLAVAIQRGPRPTRGDLVLLTGGPGQPARAFGPRTVRRWGRALDGYRLVLLDQRGTGDNALQCPALQRAMGTSDLAVPPRAAVRACAATLDGDRDAYATADTVADLDDLRAALGDDRWVLVGVSYGTFVAERYALTHPGRVRGLVLDSVLPQAGAELLERVPLRATGRVLRAVCRAEAAPCAGDPAADLSAVVRARPALGPPLFDTLTALSIGVPQLRAVPGILHRARQGDVDPLTRLLRAVRAAEHAPASLLSQGLHAATLCADSPAPWGGSAATEAQRLRALRRVRATLRPADTAPFPPSTALHQGLLVACRWWPPMPAAPAPPPGPIRATALLLAGDRDLSTPLEWARGQARAMPRSTLFVAAGAGHSVLSRAPGNAGRAPLTRFLQRLR